VDLLVDNSDGAAMSGPFGDRWVVVLDREGEAESLQEGARERLSWG